MLRNLAVIQARMASNRLPGKVMRGLGSKRAIGWAVSAAMRSIGVDWTMVATSVNSENDVIEEWCVAEGVYCFRGSEDDVLTRYCDLIRLHNPINVLRLTADCPFLDSHVISDLIALHYNSQSTYTTNQWPPTWPDGLDCEIVKASALLDAEKEATSRTDRDTVTQYIWRNQSRWPATNLACPIPLEKERWVLDSPEDLEFLRIIANAFPDTWEPCWQDIWHYLNKYPELKLINRNWYRNQRFFEALSEEQYPHNFSRGEKLFSRASKVIPNASQTFSKSCLAFPPEGPLFASHGHGAYIFDVDGNRYVDLVGSLLPNILGYNDPDVDYAVRHQLDKGISLSLATELEAELAEMLVKLIPCAEMVRFGKNGSDATSAAIKLARAFTKRDRVAIIEGQEGYHGWHDWAVAGTARDIGVPGVTKHLTHRIEPDFKKIEEWLCRHKYAAVIIDPENHNAFFLFKIRDLCEETGALLVFDEIRTGFRYSLGGYQEYCGVMPDLACFGKSMANGMPISALVGPRHLMDDVNSKDGIFWSGTFFGEALSLAAAIATVKKLQKCDVISHIWGLGVKIMVGVRKIVRENNLEGFDVYGRPARPLLKFGPSFDKTKFIQNMAKEGVLILNSNNFCYAMGEKEVSIALNAYKKALVQ